MMHDYQPLDDIGNSLTEFRTWRNTMTVEEVEELTKLFRFNIPQRWSIAPLYQAMLKGGEHLPQLVHLTTMERYIHTKMAGEILLGIGDASRIFPIDSESLQNNADMRYCQALCAK